MRCGSRNWRPDFYRPITGGPSGSSAWRKSRTIILSARIIYEGCSSSRCLRYEVLVSLDSRGLAQRVFFKYLSCCSPNTASRRKRNPPKKTQVFLSLYYYHQKVNSDGINIDVLHSTLSTRNILVLSTDPATQYAHLFTGFLFKDGSSLPLPRLIKEQLALYSTCHILLFAAILAVDKDVGVDEFEDFRLAIHRK